MAIVGKKNIHTLYNSSVNVSFFIYIYINQRPHEEGQIVFVTKNNISSSLQYKEWFPIQCTRSRVSIWDILKIPSPSGWSAAPKWNRLWSYKGRSYCLLYSILQSDLVPKIHLKYWILQRIFCSWKCIRGLFRLNPSHGVCDAVASPPFPLPLLESRPLLRARL